jgi:hypothetical protein
MKKVPRLFALCVSVTVKNWPPDRMPTFWSLLLAPPPPLLLWCARAGEGHGDAGVPVPQGGEQAAQTTGMQTTHRFRSPLALIHPHLLLCYL